MMDLLKLRDPFPAADVEWRVGRAGKNSSGVWAMVLAYIESRAIMDRLDEACGPGNWATEFRNGGKHLQAGIGIKVDDTWVWKWDGTGVAEEKDGFSSTDAGKGDFSNALKRAAVQWGIGRYLYFVPEGWAKIHENGAHYGKTKDGEKFHWDPPSLPTWALPGGAGRPSVEDVNTRTGEVGEGARGAPVESDMIDCPACGGAMYDNRKSKKGRQPDLKCKSKECDHAVWLDGWEKSLREEVEAVHMEGLIDAAQRSAAEEIVAGRSPKKMEHLTRRLAELKAGPVGASA